MSNLNVEKVKQVDANVPLFLRKLWKMLNDEAAQEIISWNSTGDGFIIHNPVNFITNLLPHYFKHSNLASFVRQLNFYDFHKVASVEKDEMQFAHNYFMKDIPELLAFITRKGSSARTKPSKDANPNNEEVQTLLNGVKDLKGRQNLINKELELLKEENSALWNEINSLRVKYSKQTKIINKLIHFLISYMHSHQNVFNKANAGVNSKCIPKNLNAGPSLLEIDYKGRLKKSDKSSIPFILNQPSSSSTITYKMEPTNEVENMDLLNSILEASDEHVAYSVQFPKSPRQKSPVNFEAIGNEMPDAIKSAINSNQCQTKKLVQIDKLDTLEDIFQVKDSANNKAITYSIKYPKLIGPMKAKTVVKPAEPVKKSKVNILGNHTIVRPRPAFGTVVPYSKESTVEGVAGSSEVNDTPKQKTTNLRPIKRNSASIKNSQQKKFTVKKRPMEEKSKISVKKPKVFNSTEVIEQEHTSDLPKVDIETDELLSIPNILNDMNTVSVPSKTLDMSILDNPKENLGVYVENTESKINDIQDILTCSNMNTKEWDNFLQNLSPIDETEVQELLNAEENYNVNELNKDLCDILEEPPVLEETTCTETDNGDGTLINSMSKGADQENFINIEEYFNNDFGI